MVEQRHWHHAPPHRFVPGAVYMVTAGTMEKQHLFGTDEHLAILRDCLFESCETLGWDLEAWAVLANHYHIVFRSCGEGGDLSRLVKRLHSLSARKVNELNCAPGRRVWFQYWDTALTYEKSYYARLNYVHNNPAKHGVVIEATQYQFCSAAWFQELAEPSFYRKVTSFRWDRIRVRDDF